MTPGQTNPGDRSTAPSSRRPAATYVLLTGAGCLLLIGAIHGAGYAAVELAVRNSGLTPWFQNSFRALWLGHALQLAVIAAILAVAAWKPGTVSRAVTILCGLVPLPSGLLLAHYNGSAATTVAFLVAAVLVVAGALAAPSVPRPIAPAPAAPVREPSAPEEPAAR